MTKTTHSKAQAEAQRRNLAQKTADAAAGAERILAEDRAIVRRSGGKVTEEEYQDALERIAAGETVLSVTKRLNLSRAALQVRANEDEVFARAYHFAVKIGAWARLENAEEGLRGGEGSTNNVRRDIALMDYAKWMAARIDRDTFSERIQVDQRSITINVDPGDFPG